MGSVMLKAVHPELATPYLPRPNVQHLPAQAHVCAAALMVSKVMDRCMPKGHLDGVCDTGHRAGRCPVLNAP